MVKQIKSKTDERVIYGDAQGWLEDCFEDCPQRLSRTEIKAGINRHYSGGWEAFVEEGNY